MNTFMNTMRNFKKCEWFSVVFIVSTFDELPLL